MCYEIRQLMVDDWGVFKDLRLYSLKESPHAYGAVYEVAKNYSEDQWRSYLNQEDGAIFGLFTNEQMIGLCSVRLMDDDKNRAGFYMAYIHPTHRGKGLSSYLYEARLKWAAQKGVKAVQVDNRARNKAATAMNKAFGFELISSREQEWADGTIENKLSFEKKL